ncbi:hypothetical protein EJ02DRAFT_454099 [Clathrospora elynae]|uniref:Uncharacterized protein n=1 Tax=Clathrospora elynae TaxID=706981 RepID=A0A6A5SPL1_9PLEO|nr:hypothetical protein EJ02DRAFT_454099 [Clathrospora elynae]
MTDELLVHISTPATRRNDELFRSLADAYLDFEPYRSHGADQPIASRLTGSAAPNVGSSFRAAADTSILSTSKDSYGSFPSHLSSDGQSKHQNEFDGQSYHGAAEDGSVPTSSRLTRLEHIHQNWKEQTTPKSGFVEEHRPARQTPTSSEDTDTAFIENTQLALQALQSQLRDSYSVTYEDTSEESEVDSDPGKDEEEDRLPSNNHDQSKGSSAVEVVIARSTAPPKSGGTVIERSASLLSNDASTLSVSNAQLKINGQKSANNTESAIPCIDFTQVSVDAFPPVPKVSVARPGTLPSQITKHLAAIKKQNPTRFKLSKKLRTPEPDDRGYWSIDCSHWSEKLQHEFWSSMYEHVLSGRLGWGTTLHRDAGSSRSLGQVKLYCWGEVVEHMWLVLWLCSGGQAAGSSLKWFDADGIAVFEVP